jgi:hypothetical protein
MSDVKRSKGRALGRGISDAIESPDATATSSLLAKVKPRALTPGDYRSTGVPEQAQTIDSNERVPDYRSTEVPQYRSDVVPTERYYRKANEYADRLDRTLSPAESKVLEHLLRFTVGFNRSDIRVRVSVLMERTGYKSDKTVRAALRGLELKGRIERLSSINSPLGDEYRILSHSGNTGVPEYRSTAAENTAVLGSKITGQLNTSLKDNEVDDDAALAQMNRAFKEAVRELTGKELSPGEAERWKELAEVLIAELRIAAARTTISSVPAFLAEHLRRRLWKIDKRQAREEGRELPDQAIVEPTEAAKSCPACAGSGWEYPNGPDGGVRKCKHGK